MKFLIIQTAFLGDVILTTPLIEVLKRLYPESQIDFLTIPASQNIIETNPHLNQVIIFDKRDKDKGYRGLKRLSRQLTHNRYDICITPHRSWRSAFLTRRTEAEIRIGFDRSARPSAFTHVQRYQSKLHEIERNLSLLRSLDIVTPIEAPRIYPDKKDQDQAAELLRDVLRNRSTQIIAVAPGSIWPTKRWPMEYFAAFCGRIAQKGYTPVLLGSHADRSLCDDIMKKAPKAISLAGLCSLRQTFVILTKSAGLLTNDSAPLHLGMAAGVPVYAIFGATVPAFGFAPFGEQSHIFENSALSCRPCGIHGGKQCPTKTFDCMLSLDPKDIEKKMYQDLQGK